MSSSDSVSVFAEGTFEEQVQELVDYIARSRPESERPAFREPFAEALKTAEGQRPLGDDAERKKQVTLQVVEVLDGLGEGSDKETEGFFNLLSSHLVALCSPDAPEFLKSVLGLLDAISQQSPGERTFVRYRVLANLFNAIPRTSPARLLVCKALLKLTAEKDELDTLQLSHADVERWLNEWEVSPEEKSDFLKTVVDIFTETSRPETAYTFLISYVRSVSSPASAESASLQLIALALRLPTVFNFDALLKLEAIQAANSHELFGLLQIFDKKGLSEFRSWKERNQSILEEYQLDASKLECKIRLLILSELGCTKIGQNIPYVDIASTLQIEVPEVEKWVIDVIRAGLLYGKLSQTTQTLLVIRASPRGFAAEQWAALEQRLLAWKEGLTGIQSVLSAARQTGGVLPASSGITQEQAA